MSDHHEQDEEGVSSGRGGGGSLMDRIFRSCDPDPKGSVHRAWGISLIFVLLYFIFAILEMINVKNSEGSNALMMSAIWTGIIHLFLAVAGTFVLKRFPTSFAVGFFLGILVILANQNLLLFGVFHNYSYGSMSTNNAFSGLAFCLFAVLTFFTMLLAHFKDDIVVAAIDVKGFSARDGDDKEEEAYQYHGGRG